MSLPLNQIIQGDCIETMRQWPFESAHCCVTSPPYWGLRDYGVDGQIGLEKTPEEYVAKMVSVFREVKRVLRKDGTLWLNLGDSYAGSGCGSNDYRENGASISKNDEKYKGQKTQLASGLKPKDLVGIPWRVAFALQQDGWYLRQDLIWHKPGPMPESVRDRCTKAHEYLFLLTKSSRYFYDNEAIKEEATGYDGRKDTMMKGSDKYIADYMPSTNSQSVHARGHERWPSKNENGIPMRNRRSVWTIPTESYGEAHFATFPKKLIEPCILAGTSQKGCCKRCGSPWVRVVERTDIPDDSAKGSRFDTGKTAINGMGRVQEGERFRTIATGWRPSCQCNAEVVPCVVLDPFMGSGTTAQVAYEFGRDYVGCELNPKYISFGRVEKAKENYKLLEMAR